jgi:uncharacterized membrane protein YdjX (TVP38/TMEM64 family)
VAFGGGVRLLLLLLVDDLEALHEEILKLNSTLVFLAIVLLPLFGVPVSLLYGVAGAKFGSSVGLAVITLGIAIHLVLSWWIAHGWLRGPLERWLSRRRVRKPRVPSGMEVPVCLLVALMPGASYAIKNYLLVLGGVRFRPYFFTLLPAHLLHASLALLVGDLSGSLNPAKIVFLILYAIMLVGASHWLYRRMKRRTQDAPDKESGAVGYDVESLNSKSATSGR